MNKKSYGSYNNFIAIYYTIIKNKTTIMLIKIFKGMLDMNTRFYRRIGGKHIKFNVSKSGVSTSFKLGHITINPQRNRVTYNTPIKGLSLTEKIYDDKQVTNLDKDILKMLKDSKVVFEQLRGSLIDNELNYLLPLVDEVIAEHNRGLDVDFGELISKVDELEAGLRNCEASGEADIDEIIYKYFETMRDNLTPKKDFDLIYWITTHAFESVLIIISLLLILNILN